MTWNVGDMIPLTLYVPDGDATTTATIAYTTPLGATGAVTAPTTADVGKTWTSPGMVVTSAGPWKFVWTIAGMGTGTEEWTTYVSSVTPVPWKPTLRGVADLIPQRTIPVNSASADPLLTFTTQTVPTAEQVIRQIDSATRWVALSTGTVDTTLYESATDVATLRAAGLCEMSYPLRDGDITTVAKALLEQADAALIALTRANEALTSTTATSGANVPQWSFPDPRVTEDTSGWESAWL